MLEIEISSIEQWQEVAEKIKQLLKHSILFLKGNLGAGKTTFTQQLVKSLEAMTKLPPLPILL